MDNEFNNLVENNPQTEENNGENKEEKKKNLKTNKKIILDEEPVIFNVPIIEEANDDTGGTVIMRNDPTLPQASSQPEPERPQVQSGNITF